MRKPISRKGAKAQRREVAVFISHCRRAGRRKSIRRSRFDTIESIGEPMNFQISLRKTEEKDLDYVLAAEQDPANSMFVIPWSREEHRQALVKPDLAHLIVQGERELGYVILAGLQDPNETIEFRRIVIKEKGKGFGKRAVQLVKELAFGRCRANRLWLDVKEHNQRAQSLYKAQGFVVEGVLRQRLKTETGYESLIVMSILREEYEREIRGAD
jgi:RimJ/RimL family protein N-acetyltransferase